MTILYSEPIMSEYWWFIAFILITFIVLMTTFILRLFDIYNNKITITLSLVWSVIAFIFTIICLCDRDIYMYDTGRKCYTVLLDDNYPIDEFYSKYIIKEHKGLMWIIEDKECAE